MARLSASFIQLARVLLQCEASNSVIMAWPRKISRVVVLTGIVAFVLLLFYYSGFSNTPTALGYRSRLSWEPSRPFHPPGAIKPVPKSTNKQLRKVQASVGSFKHTTDTERRRNEVRKTFKQSYNAYKKYAWLKDELTPVTGGSKNTFGGWGATLVDSLDTLWIMGYYDEFKAATAAVVQLDWSDTQETAINIFETTIRYLGGLLSAYDLSGDILLLRKAQELGEILYHGFDTPNRLPPFWLNFEEVRTGQMVAGTNDASASPASLCVELTRLSQLTGDAKFYDAADRVTRFLERTQNTTKLPGMWPKMLDFRNEAAISSQFTLGAAADSLYEYLPKMYALLGGADPSYEQMYKTAMETVIDKLLFRPMTPENLDILFTGEYNSYRPSQLDPESQHLTCFVGGMFGLGGRLFDIEEHVKIGEKLAKGCGWAYSSFATGIMPEIFDLMPCKKLDSCEWDEKEWEETSSSSPKGFPKVRDARYLLRPEAIESIFIMYRITGKSELRDIAWDMFEAITNATSTEIAFSAISNVGEPDGGRKLDSMEVRLPSLSLGSGANSFCRVSGLPRRSSTFILSFRRRILLVWMNTSLTQRLIR